MQAFGMRRSVRTVFAAVLAAGSVMLGAGAALAATSWARFEGFEDLAAATRACAVLKRNRHDCIAIEAP